MELETYLMWSNIPKYVMTDDQTMMCENDGRELVVTPKEYTRV